MSSPSLPARPRVLCLSGHDPCGGAGIHADIEAIAAQGAHALSAITAQTIQDSRDVVAVAATETAWLARQIEVLLADGPVAAIKLGLLGAAAQIPLLVDTIARATAPVICDPVLRAGGGRELSSAAFEVALCEQLLPAVDLLTPNADEARRLAPAAGTLEDAARSLQARGCRQVLVTGGDEAGEQVCNLWLDAAGRIHAFRWPRLARRFHGAGCTLAAAIAGRVAMGEHWAAAILHGQQYTQVALARAYAAGHGRAIPDRGPRDTTP